ncbi:GreA/GreB family elongation factor [Rhizorhabdus wittichii]|uniref:GreA/GreB family elongation factor n=2 Tax=Rhizorhabdus wittichii TaxID=160791 RepID=A0A9J9LH08_RHIWR|nr:GreA/GreB family elongation factor [Rhizorhabdus wittichii]ABQ71181.1 GreA/GreB family elongation factor [Rhizorhabdus wittichii RW1]ARR51989.1 nucleoside-diphosphate kinase [Rhizorhabdus wittichii DC-6]QTH22256.1 GreA/GreB family elongation factor [Rhizorhabdus wittichii]
MSVAFRRESDDEHLEPKFELPIPPGPNLVTERGAALIAARVAELEAAIEAAVAAKATEEQLKSLKRDLRYWTTRHATMEIQPPADGDEAAFGTRVRYRLNGQEKAVAIVGDDEADPAAGLVSFSSPLARALIGAGEGDFADFAGKADAIEVLGVEAV